MARTLLVAGSSASFTSTANTTQYINPVGAPGVSTTEGNVQHKIKTAGIINNFGIRLSANSVNASTTVTYRKNTADTSLQIVIGSGLTGWFEDVSNTISVDVDDLISIKATPGSGSTGTYVHHIVKAEYDSTNSPTITVSKMAAAASAANTGMTTASTTYYWPINTQLIAGTTVNTTESIAQSKEQYSATYRNLGCRVTANSRTTTTTIRLRKNTANGNANIAIGGGLTGWFEDTSNTDSVAANDLTCYSVTTGTGTQALSMNILTVEYYTSADPGTSRAGGGYGQTVSFTRQTTTYHPVSGALRTGRSTEAEAQIKVHAAYKFKGLAVNVNTNGIPEACTFTLRVNSANSALTTSITASTTGWFADTTHTVTVADGDLIDIALVAGTASGAQTILLTSYTLYLEIGSTIIGCTVSSNTVTNKFITIV